MEALLHVIETYGLWVVFLCVLLEQGGLPIPAYPAMIVSAAIAVEAAKPLLPILAVATLAALIADLIWYAAGRRYGTSMLKLMCRLSLSQDSCVGLTRRIYERWGAPSLVVAKFIPGFAAISTTLAGEAGTRLRHFVPYDAVGAALWAGTAIALGAIFHEAVDALLVELESLGRLAIVLLVAAVALFLAFKWWQRFRFRMQIRMSRISIPELVAMMKGGTRTTILDARTLPHRERQGWIPGAIPLGDIAQIELDPESEVIVYCDCPNEASAAVVVKKLRDRGFRKVRPLAGGMEAWLAQGHPIDR